MHKTELVALLQEKTGRSPEEVRKTVNAMIDIITESLAEGDKILLPGVGSLKVVDTSEHKGRHPRTGEEITIPASKAVRFNPGKLLRKTVKSLDFITKNV